MLRPADGSPMLGVPTSTLATWRAEGRGPEWGRYPGSRVVFYRRSDIEAYIARGAVS